MFVWQQVDLHDKKLDVLEDVLKGILRNAKHSVIPPNPP